MQYGASVSDLIKQKEESGFKDRTFDINYSEKKKERKKESLWDIQNTIKIKNICLMGVPEGKERKKGGRKLI